MNDIKHSSSSKELSLGAVLADLREDASGMWRFRWRALAAAAGAMLVAWLAISSLPDVYEAKAKIYVDSSSRQGPLLAGSLVNSELDTQLTFVQATLTSRPYLVKLLDRLQSDGQYQFSASQRSTILESLQTDVVVAPEGRSPSGAGRLFIVSYKHSDRSLALAVVDQLVANFVEQSRSGSRQQTENVQNALEMQRKDLEARLASSETQLATFKKQNIGVLPGQGGDNFTRLQTERDNLQVARNQLAVLQRQRETVNGQMRGEVRVQPVSGSQTGGVAAQKDIDARIKDAESKLEDLLVSYTDRHPEVLALRQNIADLRTRREAELLSLEQGGLGSGSLNVTANPVYQSLRAQLAKVDVDLAVAREDIAQRERRIATLQSNAATAPDIEAELSRLNRDYSVTKGQYDSVLDKVQRAQLSESADETEVVKYQLVEPPSARSNPVAPKRILFLLAAFVLSIGGGLVVAFLFNQLQPVFHSSASLAKELRLPVLGSVTSGSQTTEAMALATARTQFVLAGAVVACGYGVLMYFGNALSLMLGR
jgi:polysaccharide chain length determinant protein (PEP-CTERM system associated)